VKAPLANVVLPNIVCQRTSLLAAAVIVPPFPTVSKLPAPDAVTFPPTPTTVEELNALVKPNFDVLDTPNVPVIVVLPAARVELRVVAPVTPSVVLNVPDVPATGDDPYARMFAGVMLKLAPERAIGIRSPACAGAPADSPEIFVSAKMFSLTLQAI
jgi:hypothetical protein